MELKSSAALEAILCASCTTKVWRQVHLSRLMSCRVALSTMSAPHPDGKSQVMMGFAHANQRTWMDGVHVMSDFGRRDLEAWLMWSWAE